jgi:hypothetical protein
MRVIEQILDLARWAPSGDNTQPWRFEILADDHVVVHGFDTRRHCVYDLTGGPSQIAIGAMLETLRIAASGYGKRVEVDRRAECSEETPTFDVKVRDDSSVSPSGLIPAIKLRSVNRRPYAMRALSRADKATLEASVGPSYTIHWVESLAARWKMARLLFSSAGLRLTIKEAYDVHAAVIEWNARFSETKVPDRAIGLDPVTLHLMRWAMRSWSRTRVLSTYFGGTVVPRLELDLLPGLACSAHLFILARGEPTGIDDYIAAGGAVQRLWLTTTRLGLQHQPEMTPLIFSGYARHRIPFSADRPAMSKARHLHEKLGEIARDGALDRAVWLGRVGWANAPSARSLRLPLESLLWRPHR